MSPGINAAKQKTIYEEKTFYLPQQGQTEKCSRISSSIIF